MNDATIIAKTLGIDPCEIKNYRCRCIDIPFSFYGIGNLYFCVRKSHPDRYIFNWTPYSDQLFASLENKVMYVAERKDKND